jgi:hypothetical protein
VLYPKIIAEKHIKAARVEAMLRKTRQDKQQEADRSLAVFNTDQLNFSTQRRRGAEIVDCL